jgi:hypothetical protein
MYYLAKRETIRTHGKRIGEADSWIYILSFRMLSICSIVTVIIK